MAAHDSTHPGTALLDYFPDPSGQSRRLSLVHQPLITPIGLSRATFLASLAL